MKLDINSGTKYTNKHEFSNYNNDDHSYNNYYDNFLWATGHAINLENGDAGPLQCDWSF